MTRDVNVDDLYENPAKSIDEVGDDPYRRVRRRLVETDNAIPQIGFACGFAHQEPLTRVFRRLSGETPEVSARRLLLGFHGYCGSSGDT